MTNIQKKKHNIRLYPLYKTFSWDLLFYYAIVFIFLVKVKGFSAAQVMLVDSSYPLFKLFFSIPLSKMISKYGKKKSLVIGNLLLALSTLILILAGNIFIVFLSNAIKAFALSTKKTTESNILADSLSTGKPRGKKLFSKLEEIGTRNYYLLDGISSLLTGFCFKINGYLPMIICLSFSIIAAAISSCFKTLNKDKKTDSLDTSSKLNNFRESFKAVFHSKRIIALLIFILFFNGVLYASYTLRESLICELGVSDEAFAIIISVLTMIAGACSGLQSKIHNKFRNRALTFISIAFVPTFLIIGIISLLNINWWIKLILILFMYSIQYAMQSPYDTLISTYSKSFANSKMRIQIATAIELTIGISQFLVSFICSILLNKFSIQQTFIYVGLASLILVIFILNYMKPRIGLKPNQYDKSDILKDK